ncbi:MAG: GtrA family protein [Patescibacteria group bacterium]|nr:GtrA family protein [Patescibacteria group bacterium]
MKRIDIILALLIGEIIAWFFLGILKNIEIEIKFLSWILVISFPILALSGIWIAWFLKEKFLWIFQAAKFLLVGAVATLVDLGVLNLLIWISGIATGFLYSIFKGFSFILATCSKYLGDKFWAFEKMERMGKEFVQFFAVTLIGLGINIGAASLIVNVAGPQFGLTEKIWANIGAILAAFVSAVWNFLGYKFLVFKK